ncbi:DUF305 domain-containing protein [uncultured Cellulomonas sp.]|uniref:DUF305 domain-containing protein n=1 Tax=uncultured Cellulomonas sp. TaxID=189682 RepID=UPI00260AE697|nr:DUF305 domain-containing protein [uncultured Cellulomonas sp.]
MKTRITAGAGALALAVTLAACGSADETTVPGTTESSTQSTDDGAVDAGHNDADTEFAQMMIVHHQGAIEMADLAIEKAASEDVRALAERISAAQGPEIDEMTSWLQAWGEEGPQDADMGGMDHGGMDMGGMDMESAMTELESLSGAEFDRAFLEMMIEHHRGAIEMAETEVADGANPQATSLAERIIDDQAAEITEMEQMLQEL